jgi:Arc/MetJ-type ribon-helix-helix transcriptional regulator
MAGSTEKVSVSLPEDLVRYAEQYRKSHRMSSRSEVLAEAVRALRERELAHGYRELADEYRDRVDTLLDAGVAEGLEPSSEENW